MLGFLIGRGEVGDLVILLISKIFFDVVLLFIEIGDIMIMLGLGDFW